MALLNVDPTAGSQIDYYNNDQIYTFTYAELMGDYENGSDSLTLQVSCIRQETLTVVTLVGGYPTWDERMTEGHVQFYGVEEERLMVI